MSDRHIHITEEDVALAIGDSDAVELLGRGTYGSTFRVEHGEDEYAIKVVHFRDMPDYLWERETEALRRTDHPNLLSLRESGILPIQGLELPYLTCEYIAGGNLRARIDAQERPETTAELRQLLTGLLAGIIEIHDLGGLHRDIKPENVALRDVTWEDPVVLDFGLVRLADMSEHTVYPRLVGTVRYMAPEQLRGRPARARSDLFSIGVTVYEASTGEHPFEASDMTTVEGLCDRIRVEPPADPRDLSGAFDDAIAEVVMRLLSFRGHDRLGAERALFDLGGSDA